MSCGRVYMKRNGSDCGIVLGVHKWIDVCGVMGIGGMVWSCVGMIWLGASWVIGSDMDVDTGSVLDVVVGSFVGCVV